MRLDDRWRIGRSDLLLLALFAVLIFWNARSVLIGASDPFVTSFRSSYPWRADLTDTDRTRKESPFDDAITQTLPWVSYAHERLSQGEFPLWNTRMFSGAPFTANHLTGLFDPLILIPVWLFTPAVALAIIYLLHRILAVWFMYLFLKGMGIGRPASTFGAIAYVYMGSSMPWMSLFMLDRAYIPMTLYFLERALSRRDTAGYAGFIVSLALLSIVGYPQNVVYTLYLILAWTLFTQGGGAKSGMRRGIAVLIMIGLAFLVSAMQNLPTLDFYRHSLRSMGEYQLSYAIKAGLENRGSPLHIFSFFFPQLWADSLLQGPDSPPKALLFIRNMAYIGILAAFASVFAPMVWKNLKARFFTVVFLIGWLMVSWTWFYVAFSRILPAMHISQISPDFFTVMSMIIVGAFVLDNLLMRIAKGDFRQAGIGWTWLVVLVCGLISGAMLYGAHFHVGPIPYAWEPSLKSIVSGLSILVVAMTVFALHARRILPATWTVALLIAIELVDLVPYHEHYNPLIPKGRIAFSTPATDFLTEKYREEGPFRIAHDRKRVLRPNSPSLFDLDDMSGYDSFQLADYGLFFREIAPDMVNDLHYLDTPMRLQDYQLPFWSFLGVRYLIMAPDFNETLGAWKEVYRNDVTIFENQNWLPRWFLVPRVFPASNEDDGYAKAQSINPKEAAVAVGIDLSNAPASLFKSGDAGSVGSIDINEYKSNDVGLSAHCTQDCFLVFSDTYTTDWRAWVDDKEARVYQTDGIVKGIVVPSGDHKVRFSYLPNSYKIGWWLALAGLILAVGLRKAVKYICI